MVPSNRPVCLITGGSSGIGLATAQRFAEAGYDLAICGRDPQRLADAVRELDTNDVVIHDKSTDISIPGNARAVVLETIEQFGRLDVLVNNAGFAPKAPIDEFDGDDMRLAVAVNIEAVFQTIRSAWAALQASRGVIVNLSLIHI